MVWERFKKKADQFIIIIIILMARIENIFSHPEIEGIWLLNTLILLYCFKDSKSTAGICYSILGMNIKHENKYDTFSNYKTDQNFANVTHANTTSGQFHIPNTASAPHLYLPFHKKKFSLTPNTGRQLWRH